MRDSSHAISEAREFDMKEPRPSYDSKDEVMTVAEIVRYLRLSQAKLYRMAKAGELPAFRIGRA